jgi:hypothetical protein
MQAGGVVATACLVVSNTLVLQKFATSCAAAGLVLLHNLVTMVFFRTSLPAA